METHSVWGLAELISRILIEAVILCYIVIRVQVHLETGLLLSSSNQIIFQKITETFVNFWSQIEDYCHWESL